MTPDTFSRIYSNTSEQLSLFGSSSKMSATTSIWDSERYKQAYESWVSKLKQDCLRLQCVDSHIDDSVFSSWRTPIASDGEGGTRTEESIMNDPQPKVKLRDQATWPTPDATLIGDGVPWNISEQRMIDRRARAKQDVLEGKIKSGSGRSLNLGMAVQKENWSTPTVMDNANIQAPRKFNPTGGQKPPLCQEVQSWPTPAQRDYKGSNGEEATLQKLSEGKRAMMGQLPNYVMIDSLQDLDDPNTNGNTRGQLNPDWVEQLMGLPHGWTNLDSLATE
jgi:hypothetical protein